MHDSSAAEGNSDVRMVARRIAGECISWRVRHLGRVVGRIYDDALRTHGVTAAQVGLLTAIELSGPVHPGTLGKILGSEKSTVSRNLRALIDREWVQASDAAAEPGKLLELAPAGKALLVEIYPAWEQAQDKALGLIGAAAPEILDRFLEEVRNR